MIAILEAIPNGENGDEIDFERNTFDAFGDEPDL